MSAGFHLNHKVSWSSLKDLVTYYIDPGIEMPVGPCGLIHITNKKIKMTIDRRRYLIGKICNSSTCEATGTKVFRKTSKHKYFFMSNWIFPWEAIKLDRMDKSNIFNFLHNFTSAVHEFADTERRKVQRVINSCPDRSKFTDSVCKKIENKSPELLSISLRCCHNKLCSLFPILIEAGETETLLEFNNDEISSVFSCSHGGQTIGNNWSFLYWRVMLVYFNTNLIISLGLEEKTEAWGSMSAKTYFRQSLMYDCGGQTFLNSCRKYLKDDVYMKDFNAMRELCKMCFKFIYMTEMLAKEVGISWLDRHSLWHSYNLEECSRSPRLLPRGHHNHY